MHHSPYIVDSRSDPISVGCTIFRVARRYFRVFFSYGASQAKSERRARWTACKDAAGRQTRRATSDHVAHYRRGVFRSLSVPNVFYSDVLLCLRNSRNNGLKCMRFTAIQIEPSVLESRSKSSSSAATQYLTTWTRQRWYALLMMTSSVFGAEQHISKWSSALAVQTGRHRKRKPWIFSLFHKWRFASLLQTRGPA